MAEPTTRAAGHTRAPRDRNARRRPATAPPDLPQRPSEPPEAAAPPADPGREDAAPAREPASTSDLPSGPATGTVPGRHRAAAVPLRVRMRTGLLWPLSALLVLALVAARGLRGTPLPDDGRLAVPAYGLLSGATDAGPLSPAGLAAGHTAAYAAVTRAFARHATLTGAERELLLVALLVGAVLGWRTARRLGVPDSGCAIGLLVPAAVLAFFPLTAVATPAALAVPWSALAAWTLTLHRPPRVVLGLAAVALVPAVLLAPDLLLVLVGAAGTALAVKARRARRTGHVAAAAALTVAALGAVRLALTSWAPEVDGTARWGGSPAALLVLALALLLVAAASGWLVPALRPPAVGLAALTGFAVVPPSARVAALVLALPLAALLVADSSPRVLPLLRHATGQASVRRFAAPVAAASLAVLVLMATVGLAAVPRDDFGAAAHADLLSWARTQLPPGAVLHADPSLAAELQHAGADADLLATGAAASAGPDLPLFQVARDGESSVVPVIARFADAGRRPLVVTDPAARTADAGRADRRRRLGAAVLANPTVVAPPAVVQRLRSGGVDLRLLTLLAGLVARSGVELAELPAVPGEDDSVPVRSAVVAAVDGRPLTGGAPELAALRSWLSAQRDPLAPDDVRPVDGGLLLHFRYVTDPEGVVTGGGG